MGMYEKSLVFHVFPTEMGWVGVAGREGRIGMLVLPKPSREAAIEALREGNRGPLVESEHDFSGCARQLAGYFVGERVEFDCELDFGQAGEFDRQVWVAAREIGFGETRSYGWLAARIGNPHGARAVGQALGRNPIPVIVPCHRILRANGDLGGFGAGLDWKLRLLELERAR